MNDCANARLADTLTTEHNAAARAAPVGLHNASAYEVGVREASVRKANVRMGLVLGSIALVFFVGFVVKMFLLSRPA